MRELKLAKESNEYKSNPRHIYELRTRINELKNREECMWKQRSRTEWLKEGDKNTRYFHCRANQRNRRNYIAGLEDDAGTRWEDKGRIGGLLEDYFNSLFSTSHASDFDDILSVIQPAILEEMNDVLTQEFTTEEIQHPLSKWPLLLPLNPMVCHLSSTKLFRIFWVMV